MVVTLKVGSLCSDAVVVPRRTILLLLCLFCAAPAASAAVPTKASWDRASQKAAVAAGLLDGDARWDGPLSTADARTVRDGLAASLGAEPAKVAGPPGAPLSVFAFDALMVNQLGLTDVADAVRTEAARAGLRPPAHFGTEVVARQLNLRFNHPFPYGEALELYPWQAITRAEAAYSLARILSFTGEVQDARDTLARFVLPDYSPAQLRVLRAAVAKEGMPYIWGGETDTASSLFGGQVHGGYDCSGLVWRVFKLTGDPAGTRIRGRTAASMAGEIPASARIRLGAIAPADLLFFGPGRFDQKATEKRIVHVGIAMSPDFMINSSSQGVTVAPLLPWRRAEFSWARRVL